MAIDPAAIPRNANEAIAQRLLTDPAVTDLIGQKATPQLPDADTDGSYVVFYRTDGSAGTTLGGRRRLQELGYRLDAYGETDEDVEAVLLACTNRLFGNAQEGIAPWRDLARGVQGCMPIDDADANVLTDGSRENGQSFRLFFCPQPQPV
jgi:hypothetical protein